MAGVEDEEEFRDALAVAAADPPPSAQSPTSKPRPAAGGGGGLGRRLFASIPLPASLSAAIGRFSSPKPPASNVGLGLLLHAGPACSPDGTPASDAASAGSGLHLPPSAALQRQHGEDQVAGRGAGVGEEGLGLVLAEEGRPTAEGRDKEGAAVECSANRNCFPLQGQDEEGEQCPGDELGAAMDSSVAQDEEVEKVVEPEGATKDCAAAVEDVSNNSVVEQCAGHERRAVKDSDAVEVNESVMEQEGAAVILDAAKDSVTVESQEVDAVVAEKGDDGISVQDQHEVVDQCAGDQLRTITGGNAVQDQELVKQEGVIECYTTLEAVEQCTNDGSKAVKDANIVEEEARAVKQEGIVGVLDAAKVDVLVESQEEGVVAAEQNEDGISVQDHHKVVEQCTGDQLRTATDDEQCAGHETRAVKDGNAVEVNKSVMEQEGAAVILDAAKDNVTVESQEVDAVVAEQGDDGISVQDQHEVVDQCAGDQLRSITDGNTVQGQEVVEQEGAIECYTALEAVEQCTNDGSKAVKDVNIVEEEERAVEQESAVGLLDAAKVGAPVESQEEEGVLVAEQNEDGISVQDHHKVVEQCTGDQLRTATDDNAPQDQDFLELEGATEYYTAVEAVGQCTNDGNAVEESEKEVEHRVSVGILDAAKDRVTVESQEEDVVVAEQGEIDIFVQDQLKAVEQCTSGQLRTTMYDNAAEGQEVVEQEGAIVDRDATTDVIAVEDQEKEVKQFAVHESRATKDENDVEVNEKVVDQEDAIEKHGVIKDGGDVELREENDVVAVEHAGDVMYLQDEGNLVERYISDQLGATTEDNVAENQEVVEQEGSIVERVATTDGISVEDQEKEVEQFAGDESRATKDDSGVEDSEKVGQEDVIDAQGIIKGGCDVESLEEDGVVVAEQGGDGLSVRDVGNVVEQCTGGQLRTAMEDNAAECQEVMVQEGAIFERGVTDGITVEDQDKEGEQSVGDESRATKDRNAVEGNKEEVDQEDAIDKHGTTKDVNDVESQEENVVVPDQGVDDISVPDEGTGNLVVQCTGDQLRTTLDDNAVEDPEVAEQGFVSILGATKVSIAVESREEHIVVAEQVEDGISVQDQDREVEQCTSDQLRTTIDDNSVKDQEVRSAGYPQRPGKLNCRFYMSTGSCSYGSSCIFNHPRLRAKLEVSSFPSEQRDHEVEFLELNRVGLPIREGARKCTYYMRNGTCRYGKKCCYNHPEQVLDTQLHTPTGWDDTNLESSPHSKKSPEKATIDGISSGSEILPPNILRMLLPPQNVPPCTEEKEMKLKKDPDWSSASDNSDGCCSADSSDGPLCKQEHVDYPERPECPFLLKFGNCRFGTSCQYYHPKDKFSSRYHPEDKSRNRYHQKEKFPSRYHPKNDPTLAEELMVYPDRPGEPECPFYVKTGSCKFGTNCKFHHPKDLTPSMQDSGSPKRSVAANEHHPAAGTTLQDYMYKQQKYPERPGQPDCRYYMQFGKCKFQSACIFNHPKDILSSGWHPAECPFYMKTGTCKFGSACEFYHPKYRCSSKGGAIGDGADYEHDFVTESEIVLQQQEQTIYPERPGKPECPHFVKHGCCKFHMRCRFHHPADRLPTK